MNRLFKGISGLRFSACLLITGLVLAFTQQAQSADANEANAVSVASDSNLVIITIRVEGNVSIKPAEILAKVRTRQGEPFSPSIAAEDTKRIAELKAIEYCYYNTKPIEGGLELTFVVVEKNIIRSIDFNGNKAFSRKKLTGKLGFKVGDYLDPVLAATYTTTIAEFYHKNGYPYAEVSLDSAVTAAGKLVYNVKEGPRVKIVAVTFSGNSKLKSSELRKTIKLSTRSWVIFSKYYNEQELTEDVSSLQRAYQRKGFLNAAIEAQRQFNAEKTKIRINFNIVEGVAYSVANTVFSGNSQMESVKLNEQLKLQNGQIFNEQLAQSDTKQLAKLYKETGYVDAQVERSISFVSEDTVAVDYKIKEGERFRIGQVIITGNEQTRDRVVRRVLDEYEFQPGKWYNADIARGDGKGDLEKILQQTLLTEREGTNITPAGKSPGQRDAQVNIIEGKTGMVMVGAGVSTDSGVIGQFTFEQRNFDISDRPKSLADFITGKAFRGAGQTLRISLMPGTVVSQYSVSFTEPYLNDKPVSLDLAGSSWSRFRESYIEERTKGFIGLEKRFRDKWRRGIGLRVENVEIKDVEDEAPQEVNDVRGNNFLTGLRFGIGRDLTNSRINPTDGHSFDVSYEQVIGDFTFGIASGVYRKYYTLSEDLAERKTVLAAKLLGATIAGDAPVFEKFYAGGTGTYGIRGFRYRGVSTRGRPANDPDGERKDPIGSDWIILANAETIVPLVGDNIAMLFFIDSGAIDTGGIRASTGAGFQILIPQWFGPVPMRFELAAPLRKAEGDETQVFNFSMGTLF